MTGNIVDSDEPGLRPERGQRVQRDDFGCAGNVTQNGSANLTLAGANTYGGLTTINSGTLTLTGSTSG